MTLKNVTELWVVSNKVEDMHQDLKKFSTEVLQKDKQFQESSFRFNVEVFCNTQTYAEKMAKIEVYDKFQFFISLFEYILIW